MRVTLTALRIVCIADFFASFLASGPSFVAAFAALAKQALLFWNGLGDNLGWRCVSLPYAQNQLSCPGVQHLLTPISSILRDNCSSVLSQHASQGCSRRLCPRT